MYGVIYNTHVFLPPLALAQNAEVYTLDSTYFCLKIYNRSECYGFGDR